jgi:putative transposase
MTPNQVHFGRADQVYAQRLDTLQNAFDANPNRFVNIRPTPPKKPTAVWINPPKSKPAIQA